MGAGWKPLAGFEADSSSLPIWSAPSSLHAAGSAGTGKEEPRRHRLRQASAQTLRGQGEVGLYRSCVRTSPIPICSSL